MSASTCGGTASGCVLFSCAFVYSDVCVMDMLQGCLEGKTRILVTHQLQYLPDCDRVIVMDGGRVAHMGSYAELIAAGVDISGFITADNSGADSTVLPPVRVEETGGAATTNSPVDESPLDTSSNPIAGNSISSGLLRDGPSEIDTGALVPTSDQVTRSTSQAIRYRRSANARSELSRLGKLTTREFRVEGSVHKSTLMIYLEVRVLQTLSVCNLRSFCIPLCLSVQAAGGVSVGLGLFAMVVISGT